MLVCRSYSLPVKDCGGRTWEFVIKSWANGTENRRVYVLEQTGEYLKVIIFVLPTLAMPRLYCVAVPQLCGQGVYREGAVCSAAMLLLLLAPVPPSGPWEHVPQILHLLCVMPQLANTQSSYMFAA